MTADDNRPTAPEQGEPRPQTPDEGPVQTRKSPDGASPDRQIAQEPQQSSGLGSGQS